MIRQPVSRISFDRRRGFLGVQLQEGATFVDAAWNEAADIACSQLRDALIAGGVAGTAGRELRIDPIALDGRLRNLIVRGSHPDPSRPPRPFYCNGLPVLWLADLEIDQQALGDAFRCEATGDTRAPAHGTWIDLLQPGVPYEIYVRAEVATVDRLDDPFLDDPALDATRGTFRTQVTSDVRIRKAGAPRPPAGSNLKLSVDGSYLSDLNVLYRVELDALTGSRATPAASVLWDPDAGATVARVVDAAIAGARLVMVDSTEGFDDGFVRFEGKAVGPELYRVRKAPDFESAAIEITRHRCDRDEVSLAAWQPSGTSQNPTASGQFTVKLVVPPAVVSGEQPGLEVGDLITALPAALGASNTGPWIVQALKPEADHVPDHVLGVTLGPAGLAQPLDALDFPRKAVLRAAARQFDTTISVDARRDWKIGERISLVRRADQGAGVTPASIAAREDRVVIRIEPAGANAPGQMLVRLDQPLAFDHLAGEVDAVPERPIRVRRFAGHACRLGIDAIDPARDGAASLANFAHGQPLAGGLSIHLTIEAAEDAPRLERGDGWHVAARGDGWVETRLFAAVEDEPASEVVLARLTMRGDHHELIDLRPTPAALAVDDELARIAGAASTIAAVLGDDPMTAVSREIARLAGYPRVQPALLPRLLELGHSRTKLEARPSCRPWLERLAAAVLTGSEAPRRQLAAIGFALGGLAFALTTSPTSNKP